MKTIKKAIEYLQPIEYEPHDVGYYVTVDDNDYGGECFCKNCIRNEVKRVKEEYKKEMYLLEKYPKKKIFDYQPCDLDFLGGGNFPVCCEGCGEYFKTDFYPDLDYAKELLEDYKNEEVASGTLKWKLETAFLNYSELEDDVKEVMLEIANMIIQKKLKIKIKWEAKR